MTISRFLDFFRASGNEPGEANIAARRRFLLGAGAAAAAIALSSQTGFVGSARAQNTGPGFDGIPRQRFKYKDQPPKYNRRRRRRSRPRYEFRDRHLGGRYGTAGRCRNDWRFRRNNPRLCQRYTGYRRRRHDRFCIDLGPFTICE